MKRINIDITRSLSAAMLCSSLALASGCQDNAIDDCPPDEAFFEKDVWRPLGSTTCYACHSATGTAAGTRMVFVPDSEPGSLLTNMQAMSAMAEEEEGGTSLLLLKATGTHPDGHGGGVILSVGSPAYEVLTEFVARVDGTFECASDSGIAEGGDGDTDDDGGGGGGPGAESCDDGSVGPRMLRRLSHVEYDNTVRDLLGVDGELGEQGASFAPDNVVNGFTKNSEVLTVSGLLADQYRDAAEALADHIVLNQDSFLGCDPAEGAACVESFVTSFGARMFRRPVSAAEAAPYVDLYNAIEGEDGFDESLRWVVAAMLQSPNFLYRTELGVDNGDGIYELTPYEVAAELSYLVIGSTPDAELEALAASGEILDPGVLEAQAARLLADSRSEQTLAGFVDEWLGVGQLPIVSRDPELYPEFDGTIRMAMLGEIHRYVSEIFRKDGTFADLLTGDFTYVNSELASFYGIPGPADTDSEGFGRVNVDGVTYGGLLTQGAMNAAHAKPTGSSPIHRGVTVRERFLCQELPPPPPSLDTSPPPVDPDLSTRDRYLQHSADPACKGCHNLIDGIGFAFEHYDAIGRFRDMDGVHPVDATGEIMFSDAIDGTFDGAGELQEVLAGGEEVMGCYAQLWTEYSIGLEYHGSGVCVGEQMRDEFLANGGQLSGLVTALVRSPHFLMRQPNIEGDDPGDPTDTGDDTDDTSDTEDTTDGEEGTDTDAETTDTDDPDTGDDTGNDDGPSGNDGIEIEIVNDSMWGQGECNTVYVYNVTDAAIEWEVQMTLPGALNNHWNANVSVNGLDAVFTGPNGNTSVAGQGTASFGFCVMY